MKAALLEGIKTLKITEVETPKCKKGEAHGKGTHPFRECPLLITLS